MTEDKKPETAETEQKGTMPVTAGVAALRWGGSPTDTRYRGRHVRQSKERSRAIQRREKRLNKVGWSLYFFNDGRTRNNFYGRMK